jgi:hypothetical protein
MITAHLEMITDNVGIIRGGENWQYGEPYEFVLTVRIKGPEANIYGFLGCFNKEIRNEIKRVLNKAGVKRVKYERLKNKKFKIKSLNK